MEFESTVPLDIQFTPSLKVLKISVPALTNPVSLFKK